MSYRNRRKFSEKMQKVAIKKVYRIVWPEADYKLIEVDQLKDDLAQRLDIGGCDKMLASLRDGHTVQLAQRFRKAWVWENPRFREFTVREAEWQRHVIALDNNGVVPGFYSYGYANDIEDDFVQLYIVRYRDWLMDVLAGETSRPCFKQPLKEDQECFYHILWTRIPNRYFVSAYPFLDDVILKTQSPMKSPRAVQLRLTE